MNKELKSAPLGKTIREYHSTILQFLQKELNPVVAEYFKQPSKANALMPINDSAPQYVRNVQALMNIVMIGSQLNDLYDRDATAFAELAGAVQSVWAAPGAALNDAAKAVYAEPIDSVINAAGSALDYAGTVYNSSEYLSLLQESLVTLQKFDLKASPETRKLVSLLRNLDPKLFDLFTENMPESAKFAGEVSHAVGTTAQTALYEVMRDVREYFSEEKKETVSNQKIIEDLAAKASRELEQKLAQKKDKHQNYEINKDEDGSTVAVVKGVKNSLTYLSRALSVGLDKDPSKVVYNLIKYGRKYDELLNTLNLFQPAMDESTSIVTQAIKSKASEIKPLLKEAVLNAVKMEDELGLRPGYFLDQISPYIKQYYNFTQNVGLTLSAEEKSLFLGERQQMRISKYESMHSELKKIRELKGRIDQIETLLNTSNPLSNFSNEDLEMLKSSLPLLQLPEDIKSQFEKEIESALEGKSVIGIGFDWLKNIARHDVSVQNQVRRLVFKNFVDVESHENALESSEFSLKYSRFYELMEQKSIAAFNQEECDFVGQHLEYFADKINLSETIVQDKLAQLAARRNVLSQANPATVVQVSPVGVDAGLSNEELAMLNQEIAAKNIKMADVVKEFREFMLENIQTYFAAPVVENFKSSNVSGIFEVYSDEPKHLQDMKNFLSALTVLEKMFRTAETSYISAAFQATQLKDIVTKFNLSYQQEVALVQLFFTDHSAKATALSSQLSSDVKAGLHLKATAEAPAPVVEENKLRDFLKQAERVFMFVERLQNPPEEAIDLGQYVTQMRDIEEMVEEFLHGYFDEEFSKLFTRDGRGIYVIEDNDLPLVSDAKNLLNTLHYAADATENAASYQSSQSYWEVPAVLMSVRRFIRSLNNVNLSASQTQLRDIYARTLSAMQSAVDLQINPILEQMMRQADRAEQEIGLRQGVLTNPVQEAIDFYQLQIDNAGVNITTYADNAFLAPRNDERAQVLLEGKQELAALELNLRNSEKQFAIIEKLADAVTQDISTIPSLQTLQSMRRQISLIFSDEALAAQTAASLDHIIANHVELMMIIDGPALELSVKAKSDAAKLVLQPLRDKILARQVEIKSAVVAADKALNAFNATKGHRMAVIEAHEVTLRENALKADAAAAQAELASVKVNEARRLMKEGDLALAEITLSEARKLAEEAQEQAKEAHSGSAKRAVKKVDSDVRREDKILEHERNPIIAPSIESRKPGLFERVIMSILRAIRSVLDAIALRLMSMIPYRRYMQTLIEKPAAPSSVAPKPPAAPITEAVVSEAVDAANAVRPEPGAVSRLVPSASALVSFGIFPPRVVPAPLAKPPVSSILAEEEGSRSVLVQG